MNDNPVMNRNVDSGEIARFESLAAGWWDPGGEMAPLHVINPVRVGYLRSRVGALKDLRALDIGCGGGLLCEALAADGAEVVGIDLATASVEVARAHASARGLSIDYRVCAAETLADEHPGGFDLVCCLEMLEHVPDPAAIVEACARLVRPGGDVVFSTVNRSPKAYALMIVGAEYALKLLPRGTHDYGKFIRPSELCDWARTAGLDVVDARGMRYNPLLRHASLHPRDLDVNYLLHCRRPSAATTEG